MPKPKRPMQMVTLEEGYSLRSLLPKLRRSRC